MTRQELQNKIIQLLNSSSIPFHEKNVTAIQLPVMPLKNMKAIYKALSEEKKELGEIAEKKKRLELKYQILFDKITSK